MFDDDSLVAAYRGETEHLNAERLPLAVALCLGLLGLSGVFEYTLYPDHLAVFLWIYGFEVLAFVPLLAGRRALLRRGWLMRVNVATWSSIALLLHLYGILTGLPPELTTLGGICLMTGGSLLLPWGVRGQAVLVAVSILSFNVVLTVNPSTQVPGSYLLFAAAAAAAISLLGAYYFDLHRFAIFVEATRCEEEASVSQSLVAIAKEINDSLDADDVLDRIAGVTRSALHASWSVIMLRDPARDSFLVVGSAGRAPEGIAGLRGIEFGPGAFPLVDRIRDARDLALTDDAADPATAGLMQRWETRSLLGSVLLRRDVVVGILLAGTQGVSTRFSERGRDLFRGMAQHVAIALNNVRLVADLRRANNLKTEFLSTMSHELRTPLNVIIGYADLLRDEAFGPMAGDQREVLSRLQTNAYTLLELISATLEVNRLEAGRSGAQLRDVDLRQLLVELQLETDQIPRHSGVALRWEVPRASELVRTDPVKVKIIVRNLIGNALKFTKRGCVVVQVGFDSRSRQLDLAVRDTGPGVDPEHLPKIFDMFHQAPSDTDPGGVGLGLYIVKRFAELLGGRVSAASAPGDGALFRVALPAGIAAKPASFEEHRKRRSA